MTNDDKLAGIQKLVLQGQRMTERSIHFAITGGGPQGYTFVSLNAYLSDAGPDLSLYAAIQPDGDDTPKGLQGDAQRDVTLDAMSEALTDWIFAHRIRHTPTASQPGAVIGSDRDQLPERREIAENRKEEAA